MTLYFFMTKYRKVFRALQINMKMKTVNLKSIDQFESRRGQNLKMKFQGHFKGSHFA